MSLVAAEFESAKVIVSIETILKNLDRDAKRLEAFRKTLLGVSNVKPGNTQQNIKRTTDATQRLAETQQRLINRQKNLEAATLRANNALERARLSTQRLEQQKRRLNSTTATLERSLNRIGNTLNRVGGNLRSFGTSLTVGLTAPLTALAALSTRSATRIDAIRNRLIATEGSIQAANERLARLRTLADQSVGVTRSAANEAFSQISVIGDLTEETIERQIKAMGRLNAAFTIDDQAQFFRNMVQIFTQGFERADIKEAIGRVPVFNQLLQSAFGTSDPGKLRELKAAGKLTLDTFFAGIAGAVETNPVLANINESIGVRFAKVFERITDALEPLGRAILDPLERIVTFIEPIILKLANGFQSLDPTLKLAIVGFGLLAAAAGPILIIVGGIVTSLGGLITALTAVAGVIGAIGFPALLAILVGLAVQLTALVTIAAGLFRAWQTNFLGIRGLVADVTAAVMSAFNRIRVVFEEATQRILPSLQSITNKVLNAITVVWERYGKTVVKVVGDVFNFVVDVTETFLRLFTDFVDLVVKLIDGDWRGAWRAFARIIIDQLDRVGPLFVRFANGLRAALLSLTAFIIRQAVAFANAASRLAIEFIAALAIGIVAGYPKIQNALATMLLLAASGIALGPIAQALAARLITELRKAAAEGLGDIAAAGDVPIEMGLPRKRGDVAGAGIFRPKKPPAPDSDKAIRGLLDKLREAQDEFVTIQTEGRLANVRAGIQQQFELTKDGLQRELPLLEGNFEDRLVAVKQYFAERRRIQEAEINAELTKERALSSALAKEFENRRAEIEREFRRTVDEIERDPKLKSSEKTIALQTAEQKKQNDLAKAFNDFENQNADISTRILVLKQALLRVAIDTNQEQKRFTEELQRQHDQLAVDLLEEQGDTGAATGLRLKSQFKETLRELRVDLASLSPELQAAINNVDLSVLKTRLDQLPEPVRILIQLLEIGINKARIAERAIDVDRSLAELRLQETEIQNKVLDGVLTERQARQEILSVQEAMRGRLLDTLAAQLKIAESTQGQEDEVLRIRAQMKEVERLGVLVDEVGQQINRALFQDVQSGLEGLFQSARRGFEGLKDAALDFLDSILNTLNRFAAQSITQKLEEIFKPDAEKTQGTIGGALSRLFGTAPQAADASALATGATAAATAITTGGTAAATALATGGATASATLVTSIAAAAASFSAAVIAAGTAFTALVSSSAAAQSGAAFARFIGGAAIGDLIPASAGGQIIRVAEGGYPEAVLTTDPRYAVRQANILREYLQRTKGLFGRFKVPEFAQGGFIPSARDVEMDLLNSINRASSMPLHFSDAVLESSSGLSSMNLRIVNQVTSREMTRPYLTSEEGVRDVLNIISRNSNEVFRRLPIRR